MMKSILLLLITIGTMTNSYGNMCQSVPRMPLLEPPYKLKEGVWRDIQEILKSETPLTRTTQATSENPVPLEDKGSIGHTFGIQEESLLDVIQNKLKLLESSGQLQSLQRDIQQKTTERLQEPPPVAGLRKAIKYQKSYHDPTFTVEKEIRDHRGRLIHARGKKINPLDHFSFGEPLIFIDGTDPDQIKWVASQEGKITLTQGRPIDLSHQLKKEIFFDQGGSLTRKFHINHVPARVSQKGKRLLVETVPVGGGT